MRTSSSRHLFTDAEDPQVTDKKTLRLTDVKDPRVGQQKAGGNTPCRAS
jgi:hypothetical protein